MPQVQLSFGSDELDYLLKAIGIPDRTDPLGHLLRVQLMRARQISAQLNEHRCDVCGKLIRLAGWCAACRYEQAELDSREWSR
jgi:hypothetical protein